MSSQKVCACGKSIKQNYFMCFNCTKKISVEKVNIPLQKKKQILTYKKNKDLPTLNELKNKKIKVGDEYKCSFDKCDNVLTAGKNCKESNYSACYPCYLEHLKGAYNMKPKNNAYDDDDFIDDD
jgi:hypothetical protein